MARSHMDNIKTQRTAYTNYNSYDRENGKSTERSYGDGRNRNYNKLSSRRNSQLNIQDDGGDDTNEYEGLDIHGSSRNMNQTKMDSLDARLDSLEAKRNVMNKSFQHIRKPSKRSRQDTMMNIRMN